MTPRILLALALVAGGATAAAPAPEIKRETGTPQAAGVVHTLRTIPEACARLTGVFNASGTPYTLSVSRSSATCQPRARFVDAAKVKPAVASGWKLNDEIRVPNASCPSQIAVVHVWRKPVTVNTPELDAQGRARMYLKDFKDAAKKPVEVPAYAAVMETKGAGCR